MSIPIAHAKVSSDVVFLAPHPAKLLKVLFAGRHGTLILTPLLPALAAVDAPYYSGRTCLFVH